ncbi:hypothetical protein Bbelb_050460 [Branchiostoma belcheri]|nr:hypothetical protein Bbelb_050460 [Branchiostoma belcheri]
MSMTTLGEEHLAALEGTPTSPEDQAFKTRVNSCINKKAKTTRYHKHSLPLTTFILFVRNGMKKDDNCMLAASADQLKRLGKVKGSLTAKHVGEMTVAYLRDNRTSHRTSQKTALPQRTWSGERDFEKHPKDVRVSPGPNGEEEKKMMLEKVLRQSAHGGAEITTVDMMTVLLDSYLSQNGPSSTPSVVDAPCNFQECPP